jgi:hypothetical protein
VSASLRFWQLPLWRISSHDPAQEVEKARSNQQGFSEELTNQTSYDQF